MMRRVPPALFALAWIIVVALTFSHLRGYHLATPEWMSQIGQEDPTKMVPILRDEDPAPSFSECTPAPYNFTGVDQEDPKLIEYIRRELLIPPPVHPYKLANPDRLHFSQYHQSRIANKMLKGMKDGFFVEVGAANGESYSNSIFFERELGWRGLLIEAKPSYFKGLKTTNRNAYIINAALAITTYASEVKFKDNIGYGSRLGTTRGVTVKGLPFFSILRALDVQTIDFLSLDIESFEVKMLKTIPWKKLKIRLMCIEVNLIPEGREHLTNFLKEKGYKFLGFGIKRIDAWYALPELLETDVRPSDIA